MLPLIALFTFITLIMFYIPFLKHVAASKKSINRINKYINTEGYRKERRKVSRNQYRTGLSLLSRVIGGAKIFDGYKKKKQDLLNSAHILLKAEEFITLSFITALMGGFIFFTVLSTKPASVKFLMMMIGCVAGWIMPGLFIGAKAKKRTKLLNDQLNDAIVLISNSLKAGYSFFQSIEIVASEMTGPISEEFTYLQKEINLGQPIEVALENLVQRVKSNDMELVVTAVLIQRQVGGNLAEVLDNISTTIRDRIKIKGEVKTLTAQGRMSGLIISILPPALGVIIYIINPEHMSYLFKSSLGIGIIVFSVFSELLGIYFISKIAKVEM